MKTEKDFNDKWIELSKDIRDLEKKRIDLYDKWKKSEGFLKYFPVSFEKNLPEVNDLFGNKINFDKK